MHLTGIQGILDEIDNYIRRKISKKHSAYLYIYEFDENWFCKFNTLIFKSADMDWIDFVIKNRNSKVKCHNFDIVKGPTADDNTSICLTAYADGLYGKVGSYRAKSILLEQLEVNNLPIQIYFGSKKAAYYLNTHFKERKIIV